MASFKLKDGRPCRMRLGLPGPHRLDGPPHRGVVPPHTDTALHLLLLLDLANDACPFECEGTTRYLPLYYPLKYGSGGPSIQYAVVSDGDIKILYMSDDAPDAEDEQYVRLAQLPSASAQILPLSYEEARVLAFAGAYFQPNADDRAILNALTREHPLVLIGGGRRLPLNAGDVICRNPECEFFNRRVWFDVIAAIPPITRQRSGRVLARISGWRRGLLLRPLQLLPHDHCVQRRRLTHPTF